MFKKKIEGEVDLKCPRCDKVMKKIEKKGVVIDVCKKCNGMWLDDGEIEKLMELAGGKNGKKAK